MKHRMTEKWKTIVEINKRYFSDYKYLNFNFC